VKRFAALYDTLDRTTSVNAKRKAVAAYVREAPPADAAWGVWFLSGRRLKRLVDRRTLRRAGLAASGLPPWLFDACHEEVGDLAETLALIAAGGDGSDDIPLSRWVEERLEPLASASAAEARRRLVAWWAGLAPREAFVLNKIVTGSFRVGVSETLVVRALADVAGAEPAAIARRIAGEWRPDAAFIAGLLAGEGAAQDPASPYPFFLAHPAPDDPSALGSVSDFLVEWKWDGIRAQVIRRAGAVHVWTRGDVLATARFPEIATAARTLPDGTVLDGEVLAWRGAGPLPFARLARRTGRERLTPAALAEAPVAFVAFDLLEDGGEDLRQHPLAERRRRLEARLADGPRALRVSPVLAVADWDHAAMLRRGARDRGAEGLMLKRSTSPYRAGRPRGDWWKWKVEPLTVDAVLVSSEPGSGRRAGLYTDHTFALVDGHRLVPVAKAYGGLTDAENVELDRWIRRHTRARHGPVRSVEPKLVFEIAFEGVQASSRHASGVAVRFPRIARWRRDKRPEDADPLERLVERLPEEPGRPETTLDRFL